MKLCYIYRFTIVDSISVIICYYPSFKFVMNIFLCQKIAVHYIILNSR